MAKYNMYEVIESNLDGSRFKPIAIMKDTEFHKKYGNAKVLSVMDYDDTHTTSIIVWNEKL